MAGVDLIEQINWSSVECLNFAPDKPLANALKKGFREDDGLVLASDTDEQLLIHVPFQSAVKLSGLALRAAADPGRAPRRLKLFVDRPTIGFEEAAAAPGAAEFELSATDVEGGAPLALKPVKFARVNCLTIFVESNQGGEETTEVQKIQLFGTATQGFNVADIKDVSKEEG